MLEQMNQYFKLGIVHFMAFPETIKGEGPIVDTVLEIARDKDFQAIEITWMKDKKVREEVKKILDSSHMKVAYGAQPRLLITKLNLNDLDETKRRQAIDIIKEGVDEAYEMGASGLAFLSGNFDEDKRVEATKALVDSTIEICEYAKSKGDLMIVHEIFDDKIDKKSLIGPVKYAKEYVEEVRKTCDNFGLMVDLSHIPMLGESCEEAIMPIKDYIVHAHMGNTVIKSPELDAYGDLHPRFGYPNSENDVDELVTYLKVLLKAGYLNKENPPILSFEVKPCEGEDPLVLIANSKRVLEEAWGKV